MNRFLKLFSLIIIFLLFLVPVSATCNMIIITDPTGEDPNGAAAGSMSFAHNMFQSTFLMSKEGGYCVLSGGSSNETPRLEAIVETMAELENNATPTQAASVASKYAGTRIMCGGQKTGAAVGGYFAAYVITVSDDDVITVTPYSSGIATLPPGQRGAIIHLRNTAGNPLYGTADSVRKDVAIMIGKMIRDGYEAPTILSEALGYVAKNAGEKYGGGGLNLASGLSTGDMFTPTEMNATGYPMNDGYTKSCENCGWSIGYPSAEQYTNCPIDNTPLKTILAYQALKKEITVSKDTVIVSTYGSDDPGISETTKEIVRSSVKKNGYNANSISASINKAINNGYLIGVNYVEPKDINVKESSKAVGVYFTPLAEGRTSPPWNLPISSSILDIVGNVQTAIGVIIILLVAFRTTLLNTIRKK